MHQIQWQDRFNIGVEIVDQAHRRLFSIVQKIMDLYLEKHEDRFACVEGIKYFKAYAIQHFAEEEAYMREIGYSGYPAHKRHHDRMKLETLPALEQALYESDFSIEAVQRFIGVCTGWLTGHIIMEDRAITGGSFRDFPLFQPDGQLALVRGMILTPLQEMFGSEVQLIGSFTTRRSVADARYYQLIYRTGDGRRLRFILVIGESMLRRAAGLMFGMELYNRSEIVRFSVQEIAQNLVQRAAATFEKDPNVYQLEEERTLESREFDQIFQERAPRHSLLFRIKEDCFALCFDLLDAGGQVA